MTGNEYQQKAHAFATKGGDTMVYATLGLIEELGELCGKIHFGNAEADAMARTMETMGRSAGAYAKHIRKDWDDIDPAHRQALQEYHTDIGFDKELGDCAWMLANVALHDGHDLDDILSANIAKLSDRQNRNVIIGSGDNR